MVHLALAICLVAASLSSEYDRGLSVVQTRDSTDESALDLLQKRVRRNVCAPLQLPNFDVSHCENLSPGSSCEVSCPKDTVGRPTRYFCFTELAANNRPPASVSSPLCADPKKPDFTRDQENYTLAKVGEAGCIRCSKLWSPCEIVADATSSDDERCTRFTIDLENHQLRFKTRYCLDIFGGPKLGNWRCNSPASDNQVFTSTPSEEWPGFQELCTQSSRGRMCLGRVGMPKTLFDQLPDVSLLAPVLADVSENGGSAFLARAMAVQECRARLESAVPDSFWPWLHQQHPGVKKALFSTFPVNPSQVRLFNEIRESVGTQKFDELNMAPFAMAISYAQRGKSIDNAARQPHPHFELNGGNYLEEDMDRIEQAMIKGKFTGIQSNECRDYHKCCGKPEEWKFKWPRNPGPTVREWVNWWVDKATGDSSNLWNNPITEVPWMFGIYNWPTPLDECEWVHRKLSGDDDMEGGSWYNYDSMFHKRICEQGRPEYHPDSLPGIVVYGGVCGRMSTLEVRKTSCMGTPATLKGEPGHGAGFRLKSSTASWNTLNVVSSVNELFIIKDMTEPKSWYTIESVAGKEAAFPSTHQRCLSCKRSYSSCTTAVAGSPDCTEFEVDEAKNALIKRGSSTQCLDLWPGPKAGLWRCNGGVNQKAYQTNDGERIIQSRSRGTLRLRNFLVPAGPIGESCLRCDGNWKTCDRAPLDSLDCSKFMYSKESKELRPTHLEQCLGQTRANSPGMANCDGSGPRTVSEVAGDIFGISSSIGDLKLQRLPVPSDPEEKNRCLNCKKSYKACEYATAGSDDCTVFGYDKEKGRVLRPGGQCLSMYAGPLPGLWACSSGENPTQDVSLTEDQGELMIKSNRGILLFKRPDGNEVPDATTKWEYDGIQEISCTKANCHFYSLMSLDKNEITKKTHKEAALAAAESYNNYEKDGLWPTSHDEARLAASVVYAHKKAGVSLETLEPLLAWALQRNPALYEAWELAAEFPTSDGPLRADGQPSRDSLPSHKFWEGLSLIHSSKVTSSQKAGAEKFARRHLVTGKRWRSYPRLYQVMVNHLCGALSVGTLNELNTAGSAQQCLLFKSLMKGEGWDDATDEMLEANFGKGFGNMPTETFLTYWNAVASVVKANNRKQESSELVEKLLNTLPIGYINVRSQTFFAEHGRILLRGPYAYVLQLAGVVLPLQRRQELKDSVLEKLQHPVKWSDKIVAEDANQKEIFMDWVSRRDNSRHKRIFQATSAVDMVNGQQKDDKPNEEVRRELVNDRDAEMEFGSKSWEEDYQSKDPTVVGRYDITPLLGNHLRTHTDEEESPGDDIEELEDTQSADRTNLLSLDTMINHGLSPAQELLKFCVDDMTQ